MRERALVAFDATAVGLEEEVACLLGRPKLGLDLGELHLAVLRRDVGGRLRTGLLPAFCALASGARATAAASAAASAAAAAVSSTAAFAAVVAVSASAVVAAACLPRLLRAAAWPARTTVFPVRVSNRALPWSEPRPAYLVPLLPQGLHRLGHRRHHCACEGGLAPRKAATLLELVRRESDDRVPEDPAHDRPADAVADRVQHLLLQSAHEGCGICSPRVRGSDGRVEAPHRLHER